MKYEINENVFKKFPNLESKRLKFSEITSDDAQSLLDIRGNEQVMKFMDTNKFKSIHDSLKFINSIAESFNSLEGINWAIIEKVTNKFIGYFGFWRLDKKNCRAEIGYVLHPDYWGNGFMKETLDIMVKFGFSELEIHSIEANVNPKNLASIKLLEKFGFVKEAYFRENFLFDKQYKDSVIYSLLEKDLQK